MTIPYDPIGAVNGLFAPAYIPGNQQSTDAVAAWNAAHLRTRPTSNAGPPPGQAAAAAPAAAAPMGGVFNLGGGAGLPTGAGSLYDPGTYGAAALPPGYNPNSPQAVADFYRLMGGGGAAPAAMPAPSAPTGGGFSPMGSLASMQPSYSPPSGLGGSSIYGYGAGASPTYPLVQLTGPANPALSGIAVGSSAYPNYSFYPSANDLMNGIMPAGFNPFINQTDPTAASGGG